MCEVLVIKTNKPIMNRGIIDRILYLALPVSEVENAITAGPIIAENFPKIL